jgi:protein gp37
MGADSKIEWTDHTWNPWFGCTKVGPPCDNCYAEDMMDKRYGRVRWGAGEDRVRTSADYWKQPLKWNRAASEAGQKATVFCLSLGDIWDNEVDPLWRRQAFEIMERTPNLIYLLLSKRIGNAERMCDPCAGNPLLPRNAALGATMANQEEYDRDSVKLKRAGEALGALFTFASIEPMLGPVILDSNAPDWIIVGGESGHKARMMDLQWARDVRDQCARLKRAFFFKQTTGKKPIPDDLMIRQFPRSGQ